MNNNIELLKLPKRTYLEDSPALFYSADEVSSVLDLSFQLIRAGVFPDFSALIARSQTKGRGRYGRVWLSPPGHLYGAVKL
ncbi:MAG: hypothetical protein LBF22_02090, partial [Deltaproteobacteria bacterium]|nr:hypothetical protein [Deltaproteobacteria bacterium]